MATLVVAHIGTAGVRFAGAVLIAAVASQLGSVTAAARQQPQVVPPPIPCPVFPADNVWNRDVSDLPVHAQSAAYIASMGADTRLHMDFGSGTFDGRRTLGFPYVVVPATQRLVNIKFTTSYGP